MRFAMLKKSLLLALLLVTSSAFAQNVQQSGTVTNKHIPYWVTSGVIADSGSATDSFISSIGVTNNGGAGFCVSSDRQSAVGRNQLCFGAATAAAATISLQNYGTAAAQALNLVINGTTVSIPPATGGTLLTGNAPFTAGHVPCFVSSAGVIQDCGLSLSSGTITAGIWQGTPVAVTFGGTGASSASAARTNLGLGTISTQNSNTVAITGGIITGLPTPTNPSDVAIKSYVDAVSQGLIILAQSRLATAAVLPNTPTYANGSSGVGATLTSSTNSTLTVDGTVANLNDVVLVKNQASAFQNGIYTVTTAGSGAAAWVLTRATYFNTAAAMKAGSYTFVTAGSVNINSSYVLAATIVTVGTDAVTFNLFSSTGVGVTSFGGVTGAIALGSGLGMNGSTLATTYTASGSGAVAQTIPNFLKNTTWVLDYGAACDGSTDDTTAIQNAINALPNDGGIVYFPQAANCKISSTLTIGNGTTSAVSTKRGVILRGAGIPNTPTGLPSLNGYTTSTGPKLTWAGGATPMISIAGPLQGWGVENLILDCASVAGSTGLGVVSAQFGNSSNLSVQNCASVGISSTSNPLGGYTGVGNVDSLRNNWTNINVYVPNVFAAKGILLNGDAGGTSDTDYNTFTNVFIRGVGTAANFGLYLGVSDANVFNDLSISGFATAGVGMQFDYSINSNFPSSTTFIQYEIGGSIPFSNLGSPGAQSTPNKFYGLIQANLAPAPILANTEAVDGPWRTYIPSPSCGTATFSVTAARFKTLGKTTFVEFDATITTLGTGCNAVSFTLPNNPNSGGGVAGREITNGLLINGAIQSTTPVVGLVKPALSAFNNNERVVVSGVYENQ